MQFCNRILAKQFSSLLFIRSSTPSISQKQNFSSNILPTTTPSDNASFVERARAFGIQALLNTWIFKNNHRYDRVLKGLQVNAASPGLVSCSMKVTADTENAWGNLHGAAIAAILDAVGTIVLLSVDVTKAGVSVEMNVSFMSPGKTGDTVFIEGRVLKLGRRLGFTEVEFFSLNAKGEKVPIAIGRHTKAF